ncbi:MAG: hypothetical protein HYU99_02410 [Deltaproteobacteria bacterium]|nr:hypothetical protein [Deltaproteobacteria bacterium]
MGNTSIDPNAVSNCAYETDRYTSLNGDQITRLCGGVKTGEESLAVQNCAYETDRYTSLDGEQIAQLCGGEPSQPIDAISAAPTPTVVKVKKMNIFNTLIFFGKNQSAEQEQPVK